MTMKMIKYSAVPLTLCATSVALGQATGGPSVSAPDDGFTPVPLERTTDPVNTVSMGFQLGFNLKTTFKHIGKFGPATNPGPANSGTNHVYDDGYNLVDSTGNRHFNGTGFTEGTWNWGFTGNGTPDGNGNGMQVHNNGAENGTIDFHSTSSSGGSSSAYNDPPPGLMLTFGHQFLRDEKGRWLAGLEGSFGYTDYYVKQTSAVKANGNVLTDSYSLLGTTVPSASSYQQGFTGSTPPASSVIIGDTPTRSFSTQRNEFTVSGTRSFGADIFAFKLGPYFEVPLNNTFSISLEGGGEMVYVYSHLQYKEQVVEPVAGLTTVKAGGDNSGVEFGGYVGAKISAALNDQWSLFSGAQWQGVSDYTHQNGNRSETATLNLSSAVFFTAGVAYSF